MKNIRKAGVLLHISSLPGDYGIGTLGKQANKFARSLAKCGVRYWQILPLVQTGFGDSPYQSVSCTSGNPYFIDLDDLGRMGLLKRRELKELRLRYKKREEVDYGELYVERYATLRKAYSRFFLDDRDFHDFVKGGTAEDYALFMTAKTVFGGTFTDWEEKIARRDPEALEHLRTQYHEEYLFWQFLQYLFVKQWKRFKETCARYGIRLIGDLPLYVAYDSADVWAHPELFKLDADLRPVKVAGVPPDYFSATGQLWGNPVYDWDAHRAEHFTWWTNRLRHALSIYDLVRIDHFRGIDRYYEVDAGAETAADGAWQQGPGTALFSSLTRAEREHIVAEDLGIIDDGVRSLLRETGFPGMKVLLFAFDGNDDNDYLPKNIGENSIVYTGTHDNDTVKGHIDALSTEQFILLRSRVAASLEEEGIKLSLGARGEGLPEAFVRLALASDASIAVIPVQDLLGLGNEARMNLPGSQGTNWKFRLKKQLPARTRARLKKMIKIYRR